MSKPHRLTKGRVCILDRVALHPEEQYDASVVDALTGELAEPHALKYTPLAVQVSRCDREETLDAQRQSGRRQNDAAAQAQPADPWRYV